MRWRWLRLWHRPPNGEAAKRANKAAIDQLRDARGQSSQVDQTTSAARELARRTDLFAREVERAMRLRGTT